MPRPQKCRCICSLPKIEDFAPQNCPRAESVNLTYDEYEVVRLLDYLNLTQEECAKKLNVSRPTVTRIYEEARHKIADMLVNGKRLTISGGDVQVCTAMRPECENEARCCHRQEALLREKKETGNCITISREDNS